MICSRALSYPLDAFCLTPAVGPFASLPFEVGLHLLHQAMFQLPRVGIGKGRLVSMLLGLSHQDLVQAAAFLGR